MSCDASPCRCCFSSRSDWGSSNSGYYELQAVLTHQGRSSSSGHYVAWVKRKEGEPLPPGPSKWGGRCFLKRRSSRCSPRGTPLQFLLLPRSPPLNQVSGVLDWLGTRREQECGLSGGGSLRTRCQEYCPQVAHHPNEKCSSSGLLSVHLQMNG